MHALSPAPALFDRNSERTRVRAAVGVHSRILVAGPQNSEVPAFAKWIAAEYAATSRCIWWDFNKAPGVEGVDILRDLAAQLPEANRFEAELAEIRSEFSRVPQVQVSQVVGEHAEAGNDQTIAAEVSVPTLADHFERNLYRLGTAFFHDIEAASNAKFTLLLLSGIRIGNDDPTPRRRLLDALLSSVWRLAEGKPGERLCVVLALSAANTEVVAELGHGTYCPCGLDLIGVEEAAEVFVESISDLTMAEAKAVIQSVITPEARGISYTELRERITMLKLHRLERMLGDRPLV